MSVRTSNCRAAARAVAVLAAAWSAAGCGDVAGGDWAGPVEENVPERLRGLSLSYDVTALFRPEDPPLPPEPARLAPTVVAGHGPVSMTVWWQTPDGRVRSEDRLAAEAYGHPSRYAGALWVAVTPLGTMPQELADVDPDSLDDARAVFGS